MSHYLPISFFDSKPIIANKCKDFPSLNILCRHITEEPRCFIPLATVVMPNSKILKWTKASEMMNFHF